MRIAPMRRTLVAGIVALLFPAALWLHSQESGPPKESASDTSREDQKVLQTAGLATNAPALLDYFRKRTYPEPNAKDMAVLVAQLGAEEFTMREKAYQRLQVMGAGALDGIKDAEKSKDPEISRRAFGARPPSNPRPSPRSRPRPPASSPRPSRPARPRRC